MNSSDNVVVGMTRNGDNGDILEADLISAIILE